MSNTEIEKDPYPKHIKIKHHDFYYVISEYEFTKEWLSKIDINLKMNALKKGKPYKRWVKAMNGKGGKNHATYSEK